MLEKVDWSKAPDDAQAYMPGDYSWIAGWWKKEGAQSYFCNLSDDGKPHEWRSSGANPWGYFRIITRPESCSAQWRGPQDGLPPVGTVCERNITRSAWCETKILARTGCGSHVAYQDTSGQLGWTKNLESFRPIELPEQKAARARDLAVNEMWQIYRDSKVQTVEEALGRIYDAGYRKQ